MCLCTPEVQREAEGDCRHERVPRAVGQPVPAGHQAAHVRPSAQDRGPRHADPGPIPLPGTSTRLTSAFTFSSLLSLLCNRDTKRVRVYEYRYFALTVLVQYSPPSLTCFRLVHTQVLRVHRVRQRRHRGLQAAQQGRAGGQSARGKFTDALSPHPNLPII